MRLIADWNEWIEYEGNERDKFENDSVNEVIGWGMMSVLLREKMNENERKY